MRTRTLTHLSAIYLVVASAFTMTIVLADHPRLAAAARSTTALAMRVSDDTSALIQDCVLAPGWALVTGAGGPSASKPAPQRIAKARTSAPRTANPEPKLRPQILPPRAAPKVTIAVTRPKTLAASKLLPQTKVTIAVAPAKPPATLPPFQPASPAEIARVREHLKDSLTHALYANFDLFLYVSKAAKGPVAQHMFVFAKNRADTLDLRYDWPVSTGREKVEYNKAGWKLPSFTPAGYYELDPHRMYRHYRSIQWGTPMPHAMFFNWVHDGDKTGLAIHAAQGADIGLLGKRASGGCVHLSPEDARVLFDLIRKDYRGKVPRFAFNRKTDTMSNHGELMRSAGGRLRYFRGYKVLIVIENYGGNNVVATIM